MSSFSLTGVQSGHGMPARPTPNPKLVNAAHEFEAQLMNELLKPMTQGDGLTGSEEEGGLGSAGALGDFASEALGRALSNQGGLGIAKQIIGHLSQSNTTAQTPAQSGIGSLLRTR